MSASFPAAVALDEACKKGDTYSGLQMFKAVLQRKIRSGNESGAHDLLDAGLLQAAVANMSVEVGSELCAGLLNLFKCFNHTGDEFVKKRLSTVHNYLTQVEESHASPVWCEMHVKFLRDALLWLQTVGAGDAYVADLNSNLCRAYLRLAHSRANARDGSSGSSNDEEAICEALAAAYNTSHLCPSETQLIRSVASEVQERLTEAERPFLIARTVYGVLSGMSRKSDVPQKVLLTSASTILHDEGVSADASALSSFLHDVVQVMVEALPMQVNASETQSHTHLVDALCNVYYPLLPVIRDLDWVALSRSIRCGGV
ncbi:hypothetical protein DQ04_01041110 [Trypanosoma grayi]|uniref:hypothetical protein n=1 Tax=Trypanosoma grayi TaxID=71804 RepID=UPI0004F47607|nr:hypothetical protein DQ04_01041110 [Trypanosoma grayi]KEG13381.1 hypothetical protein DQ04_01041110 [Trypanosoma grayi]